MKYINQHIWFWSLVFIALTLGCRENPIELTLYGRLEGEVTNEAFVALENVVISTNPATEVLNTDPDGAFVLEQIPVGNYVIRARLDGFDDELVSIEIDEEQTTELSIVMSESVDDNEPPVLPNSPTPANGASDIGLDTVLTWSCSDPDANDTLQFDLVFFASGASPGTVIASELTDSVYRLEGLAFGTTYYWQVIASDGKHAPVYSEVWEFTTLPFPENRVHFTRKVDGKYVIFSADETGNALAITSAQNNNWRPRLGLLRQQLAYLSYQDLKTHLYVMKPNGTMAFRVTSNVSVASSDNFNLNYCWSPDGAQMLFMHFGKLYRINKDGTGLHLLAQAPPNEVYSAVDWAGQGNKIITKTTGDLPYNTKLYLITEDGGSTQILHQLNGTIGSPSFSVDGKYLLFSYDASGFQSSDGRQLDARIYLYHLETGAMTDISFEKPNGTNDLEPRFSPTGAHIIFTNTPNDGISRKDIWIMEVDGENRELFQENAEMPDWR